MSNQDANKEDTNGMAIINTDDIGLHSNLGGSNLGSQPVNVIPNADVPQDGDKSMSDQNVNDDKPGEVAGDADNQAKLAGEDDAAAVDSDSVGGTGGIAPGGETGVAPVPPVNINSQLNSNGDVVPPANTNNQPMSNGDIVPPANTNSQPMSNGDAVPPANANNPVKSNNDVVPPVNINSQLNSNGDEEEMPEAASPPSLHLLLGNTSVGEACQLNKEVYHQLVHFYPQHCLSQDEVEERSVNSISN